MNEFNPKAHGHSAFPFEDVATSDFFNFAPSDKGFANEMPLVPDVQVDLNSQLKHVFNDSVAPFVTPIARPSAVIPVAPPNQLSGDMASYIRSKAYRGFSLIFVGPGGSGSTFMSLNCAARFYSAGFSTALIDGDLTGHSVQYLTRLGFQGDVFTAEAQMRTLRPGFDLYGATQFMSPDKRTWTIPQELAARYDFIVVDIPIIYLNQSAQVLAAASRIAVTVESSNWGIGKAALALSSVSVDSEKILRERGRLIYNRSDKLSAGLFGTIVHDDASIKNKMEEVFGVRCDLFTSLPLASIVGSYASAEEYWFSDRLFSDSAEGADLFDGVVHALLA